MSRPSLLRDGICAKRRVADIGSFNVGEHLKLDFDRLRVLEWLLVLNVLLELRRYFPCISMCVRVCVCVRVRVCVYTTVPVCICTNTHLCMNSSNTLSSLFLLNYPADTQFITVDSYQIPTNHNWDYDTLGLWKDAIQILPCSWAIFKTPREKEFLWCVYECMYIEFKR